MQVNVLYFASLRERRGVPRETLDVAAGTTVGGLYADLFGPDAPVAALTVDRKVCPPETPLPDGAEVAFLPPLGGG